MGGVAPGQVSRNRSLFRIFTLFSHTFVYSIHEVGTDTVEIPKLRTERDCNLIQALSLSVVWEKMRVKAFVSVVMPTMATWLNFDRTPFYRYHHRDGQPPFVYCYLPTLLVGTVVHAT